MVKLSTCNKRNKEICRQFGIQSEVKIVLVKLKIDNAETADNLQGEAHIKIHTRKRKLQCSHKDCSSKSFSSKGNLNRHMKTHTQKKTPTKKYSCTFCFQIFQSNDRLLAHMWKHTGEKPFYCKMCKQGFTTKIAKQKHETNHCKLRPSSQSDLNESGNRTVDNYWRNWRKDRYLLQCGKCDYVTTRKYDFEKHMGTHTGEPIFACSKCPRKFATTPSLKSHMRIHSGLKPFECPHCDFKSAHRAAIPKHVASIHTKETRQRNFACHTCGKAYYTKDKLHHHQKQHSNNRAYYTCQFCGNKYTENFSKADHEKRCQLNPNRTQDKRFKCGICNYATITNAGLERHLKTHTKKKPFACPLCPYKCPVKYALNSHIRSHTGEKLYKCEICKYSLANSGAKRRHMRTHTGEKPYKCEECGFSTAYSEYLRDHVRRHKGIKPHACPECNYKSVSVGDVKRHRKSMHT